MPRRPITYLPTLCHVNATSITVEQYREKLLELKEWERQLEARG